MTSFSAKILNDSAPYALDEELVYVRKLADRVKASEHVLVLGAGPGVFVLAMLEKRLTPPTLTVIDYEFGPWFDAHLWGIGVDPNGVIKITGDTASIGRTWDGPRFSLVVVDADHSYEGVCRDIKAWWPHLKLGGWMIFHDYLEREDGFKGADKWYKGSTAEALHDCLLEDIYKADEFGISIAIQKKPAEAKVTPKKQTRKTTRAKK